MSSPFTDTIFPPKHNPPVYKSISEYKLAEKVLNEYKLKFIFRTARIQVFHFLFGNEVLGYYDGVLITVNNSSSINALKIRFAS